MKTIIKIFAVVLAAVPVLVSCYSEPLPEVILEVIPEDGGNGSEQDTTARVIIVSFDTKATRTEFSKERDYSSQPIFEEGDEIYVANGTGFDTPKVEYKNIGGKNVATISTTLSGSLKLVYPSNCVKLGHSEVIDEGTEDEEEIWAQNPNEIAGIIVPPVQTGYFKDANICMAEMEADDTKATFHNETAVFVIDVPDNTKYLEVTSLRTINTTTGQRFTNIDGDDEWATISRVWNGKNWYSDRRIITIGDGKINIPDPCFVSIMVEEGGEVLLRDLNFDAHYRFDTDGLGVAGAMGGFSPFFLDGKFDTGSADTKKVQKGVIYTGVEDHLHDYINGGYLKWATMNIGASSTTDRGLYFAWGETIGHEWNEKTFEGVDGTSGYAFTWDTSPTAQSSTSADLKASICPNSILALEYDAAYKNWGGAWRMPRNTDQKGLEVSFTISNDIATSPVRGVLDFTDVGYGNGTSLNYSSSAAKRYMGTSYWSSTLYSDKVASYYTIINNQITTGNTANVSNPFGYRYIGHAIRPVSGNEIQ